MFCSVRQQCGRVAHLRGVTRWRDRLWSLPLLPQWVSVLFPTCQSGLTSVKVDGKIIDGASRRHADCFCFWLIQFSVCNHLQFRPLETQENYNINLESSDRSLKSITVNLVDKVWKERPPLLADVLTRLPDRVIRGFIVCVCVCQSDTLPVCW